jgi:hypothetical protein
MFLLAVANGILASPSVMLLLLLLLFVVLFKFVYPVVDALLRLLVARA